MEQTCSDRLGVKYIRADLRLQSTPTQDLRVRRDESTTGRGDMRGQQIRTDPVCLIEHLLQLADIRVFQLLHDLNLPGERDSVLVAGSIMLIRYTFDRVPLAGAAFDSFHNGGKSALPARVCYVVVSMHSIRRFSTRHKTKHESCRTRAAQQQKRRGWCFSHTIILVSWLW